MTISDKERREVAERLRELAKNRHYVDEFIAGATVGFWRGEATEGFDSDSLLEVADLIDRPTAKREDAGDYWRCTHCGAFTRKDAIADAVGFTTVRRCGNCGREWE